MDHNNDDRENDNQPELTLEMVKTEHKRNPTWQELDQEITETMKRLAQSRELKKKRKR